MKQSNEPQKEIDRLNRLLMFTEAERDRYRRERDELIGPVLCALQSLQLVAKGLKSGDIKARPVMNFDVGEDAMSLPMQSLDEIVDADISNIKAIIAKVTL